MERLIFTILIGNIESANQGIFEVQMKKSLAITMMLCIIATNEINSRISLTTNAINTKKDKVTIKVTILKDIYGTMSWEEYESLHRIGIPEKLVGKAYEQVNDKGGWDYSRGKICDIKVIGVNGIFTLRIYDKNDESIIYEKEFSNPHEITLSEIKRISDEIDSHTQECSYYKDKFNCGLTISVLQNQKIIKKSTFVIYPTVG
ncbi:MAG: hypothetical protein ACK5GO_07135 [Ignavibacteria bacterium]|jgi:hypothetical protein